MDVWIFSHGVFGLHEVNREFTFHALHWKQPSAQHPVRWRGTFGGPLKPVIGIVKGPLLRRVITSVTHLFSAIYRGYKVITRGITLCHISSARAARIMHGPCCLGYQVVEDLRCSRHPSDSWKNPTWSSRSVTSFIKLKNDQFAARKF